jgi:phage gp16-like protein
MTLAAAKSRRNKLIQLIHVGKSKMGLDDDSYTALLEGVAGKSSCTDMTVRQLEAVLRAMRRNGFPVSPRRVRPDEQGRGRGEWATAEQLEYIKGMWAKCARNKSDAALYGFVKRIAHVKALRFLTEDRAKNVILALRDMMAKAGFDPDTSETLNG